MKHTQTDISKVITNRDGPEIELFTPREIRDTIEKRINSEKAPGLDMITGRTLY